MMEINPMVDVMGNLMLPILPTVLSLQISLANVSQPKMLVASADYHHQYS
jgi:hypothetical protein